MAQKDLQPDVNFLFEMGNLRFVPRMWRRFWQDEAANVAEHHFRMFWIAMVIAAHEKNVDTGKVAKMVLVHDITESRTGDVDYLSRQYVDRKEELAITDMLAGTALEKEFYELWQEYEKRESTEAKIVKDADNLDVDFEMAERAAHGQTMPEAWHEARTFVARERLHTKTAKKLFDQLACAKPHDWHLQSRNRRNGGDWQK
jgi:putative hydrolase of HD superfamily